MGTTVTWLMVLHLVFTYVPKVIDAVQGVQQIEETARVLHPELAKPLVLHPQFVAQKKRPKKWHRNT